MPILVACLGQGLVGNGGMAFALQNHMVHVKLDKIHRSIRDYKLAIGRACRGQFLRTQLHWSYVFSLNCKPFGTGGFFQHKQSMLESFLASHSTNSEIWIRYRELLWIWDFHPSTSMTTIYGIKRCNFHPFSKKGAFVNKVCNEMLAEYHAFKMVLEDSLGLDDESNLAKRKEISPKEELSPMKKTTGGFKLAWKLMTEDLYYHSHILLEVTRPLWSLCAAEIQSVKSPQVSLCQKVHAAGAGWLEEVRAFVEDSNSASEFNIFAVHI